MPRRSERGSSGASSTQSFSEDHVRRFSGEYDDTTTSNSNEKERPATSQRRSRRGLVAVQASERLTLPSNRRGDTTSEAPTTARAYAGGLATVRASERLLLPGRRRKRDRVRSLGDSKKSSGEGRADNAGKLEEGIISHVPQGGKPLLVEKAEGGAGQRSKNHRNRDAGFLAALRTMIFGARDPESDLNVETLEELHMVTGFTSKELRITRSHFLALVNDPSFITREEFLEIPSVANNPLQERLLVCFGFDSMANLKFREFVEILSIFNNPSAQRDQKLRMAFTLVDIDGDGLVSKNDLIRYLELITAAPEGVKIDLNAVAARIIEEAVSTPGSKSLSLADFIKVMGAADFDDKLTIPL
eukprot:g6173.t1